MFKRRFKPFRRRAFRSSSRRSSPSRSFARKKYDRIVFFNNMNAGPNLTTGVSGNASCGPIETSACSFQDNPPFCGPASECGPLETPSEPPCLCCVTKVNFLLVNNTTLESFFQDNVTVVRMYGDIRYRAVLGQPFGGEYCTIPGKDIRDYFEFYGSAYAEHWNWGLRKHLRTQGLDETSPVDNASPIFDYDWTESSPPWIKQWNKTWFPRITHTNSLMSKDSILNGCTTIPGYIVPPWVTGTSPGYVVPPSSCVPYSVGENGVCPQSVNTVTTQDPPWHRMRFSVKRHIKMVRDQDLVLSCAIRHPQLAVVGGWPCIDPAFFPNIARAFDVSYQFFVRIAGVVRLN